MKNAELEKVKKEKKLRQKRSASRPAHKSNSDPTEKLTALHHAAGNHAIGQLVQAKLKISQPSDPLEKEADRVAEQILQMKVPVTHATNNNGNETTNEPQRIWRKSGLVNSANISPVSNNFTGDLGPGRRLDAQTRAYMEPRFGQDFSHVRIHTGTKAAETAHSINARAFTLRNNIVFSEGQYTPNSSTGKKLLAHELAHVGQQNSLLNNSRPVIQRSVETEEGGETTSIEEPLLKMQDILNDSAENLVENLVEEAIPQTKILIITAKLANAFGKGLQRGIMQARKRLNYDAIVHELATKSDYDEKDIEKFQHIRRWQKNAVDEFPNIIREGLKDLLIAVGKEFIEEAVDRLVGGFAERVSDEIGDAVGDFLTGDYIEAIDIINQPLEDMVQELIKTSGKHLTVAFSQALATNIAEAGLTELESRRKLEEETKGQPPEVTIQAEFIHQAAFEAALPFKQVLRNVSEKLDALKLVIKHPAKRKKINSLQEKFSRDMVPAMQAVSEFESRFSGIGKIKRPFTEEDEQLQKKIVRLLKSARDTIFEIDLEWGVLMIMNSIPTVEADKNSLNRTIFEFRD